MRVLQVCPYDIARAGGVQRHIVDLSRALSEQGHHVTVVAPAGPQAAESSRARLQDAAQLEFHALGRCTILHMQGTGFELTWAGADALDTFVAHGRAASFDVAHFHTVWSPFMPWQLFRRIEAVVRRRVATFHETLPPNLSGSLMRTVYHFLGRRLSRRLDAMVAVSESAAAHLRPHKGCPLLRLPPCIDLRPYRAVSRAPRSTSSPVVLFVGRLEPRKGVLVMIDAFARVRAAHANACLVICGDGEQRGKAQAFVRARRLEKAVTFTGALTEAEKRELYRDADVFCAPSLYGESYGLVIAEAMAAGVPVVASANPGYRTVLTQQGAAGLVPPNDPGALAGRLCEVIGSLGLRHRLSAWGLAEAWRSDINSRLPDFLAAYSTG